MLKPLLIVFASLLSFSVGQTCPYPRPSNQTAYHAGKFTSSLVVLDQIANVSFKAIVPNVVGRDVWFFVGGSPKNISTGPCSSPTLNSSGCNTEYSLTGSWNTWVGCPGWKTTGTNSLTMINYAWLVWNDTLEGGLVRTSSTSARLQVNLDRDVTNEVQVPLYLDSKPPSIKFTSILFNPADKLHNATLEVSYSVTIPCPFTAESVNSTIELVKDNVTSWTPSYKHCVTGPVGAISSNTYCGNASYTQMVPGTCVSNSHSYNGTLVFQMLDNCFADGNYTFSYKSGNNWVSTNLTLDDGFDLCGLGDVNSGVRASMSVKGSGSVNLGEPVMFNGNVTGYGLPLAKVAMTDAIVVNTAPQFHAKKMMKRWMENKLTSRQNNDPWCDGSQAVMVNVASTRMGASVAASSEKKDALGTWKATLAIDGKRKWWGTTDPGYWRASTAQFPQTLTIMFNAMQDVMEVIVTGIQATTGTPDIPQTNMPGKGPGVSIGSNLKDFDVEYNNGSGWQTFVSVTGNNDVLTDHFPPNYAPVSATGIRIVVKSTEDGLEAKIAEVEAYSLFKPSQCVTQLPNGAVYQGYWVCLADSFYPMRVKSGLPGCVMSGTECLKTNGQTECFQNILNLNGMTPTLTCGKRMLETFGTDGYDTPFCTNAENGLLDGSTVPMTTPSSAVNGGGGQSSSLMETSTTTTMVSSTTGLISSTTNPMTVYSIPVPPPPPPAVNYAESKNGATAVGSSTIGKGFGGSFAIDGNLVSSYWQSTSLPATLNVKLSKKSCVAEVDYFTMGDDTGEPSQSTKALMNGDTDYFIDYKDQTGNWINIEKVKGNTQAWRRMVLPSCVDTDELRVTVTGNVQGKATVMDFQAWDKETMIPGTTMDLGGGWRDVNVFKPDDVDLDNVFGTAGWWVSGGGNLPGWIRFSGGGIERNSGGLTVDNPAGGTMMLNGYCVTAGKDLTDLFTLTFDASGGVVLPTDMRLGISLDGMTGKTPSMVAMNFGGSTTRFDTSGDRWKNGVLDFVFFDVEPTDGAVVKIQVAGNGEVCVGLVVVDTVVEIPAPTNTGGIVFQGIVPAFVNSVFGNGGDPTSFAQKAKWKAGFGDEGDTEWSADGAPVKELKNSTVDVALPFMTTLTPFAGKSLGNSFATKSQYGDENLGFGLQISWRGYFDVNTAEALGFRRRRRTEGAEGSENVDYNIPSGARYMLSKRGTVDVSMVKDIKVEAKVKLIVPRQTGVTTLSTPTVNQGVNKGVVIGAVVGGVILLVGIVGVAVGLVVKRRRKRGKGDKGAKRQEEGKRRMSKVKG